MNPNPVYPTVAAAYAAARSHGWTIDDNEPTRATYPDGDACRLTAVNDQAGWQWQVTR